MVPAGGITAFMMSALLQCNKVDSKFPGSGTAKRVAPKAEFLNSASPGASPAPPLPGPPGLPTR